MADGIPYQGDAQAQDTLIALDRMFRLAADHPISTLWRFHADTCYKFECGDQWTSEERATLKERNQPEIVENAIRPTIERLQGQFRQQKTNIKFMGRNPGQDQQKAEGYSDLLKHIDYINSFEFIEGEAVKDQLISGIGWVEAIVQPNELGQQQVRYRREDPFTMFVDPFCRTYDLNVEARYVCRAKWFDEETALQLWGEEKANQIAQVINTSQPSLSNLSNIDPDSTRLRNWEIGRYYDTKNRRFRPVEIWYKQKATQYLIELPDGTTKVVMKEKGITRKKLVDALASLPDSVITERSVDQMWCAVYCGGIFLEEPKPSPYRCNLFPFIPYYCYRKIDGEPQGYVWGLMDPQREVNARRSKALWSMNNRQTIFERNSVRDKNELANEMAKMDGQIELENGKFEKFMVKENQDISQGNLTMLQEAKMAMRWMSGEDQMNPAPEVRSGTGIQRLQMNYKAGILPIFDNIRRSRRLKAVLTFELIKQFYTDEMVFQVTEDPNLVKTIRLTASHFESLKEELYDLVAVDTVDHTTSQAEQFDMLTTTIPQVIQYGPAWAKLFVSMSDLRNKEGILKLLDQMTQPPPTQPKVSIALQWNELTPMEKAVFSKQFQWGEMVQVEMQGAGGTQTASERKDQSEVLKMKMKTEADVKRALITAHSTAHGQRVDLETSAMAEMSAIHQQKLANEQSQREAELAAAQPTESA